MKEVKKRFFFLAKICFEVYTIHYNEEEKIGLNFFLQISRANLGGGGRVRPSWSKANFLIFFNTSLM